MLVVLILQVVLGLHIKVKHSKDRGLKTRQYHSNKIDFIEQTKPVKQNHADSMYKKSFKEKTFKTKDSTKNISDILKTKSTGYNGLNFTMEIH